MIKKNQYIHHFTQNLKQYLCMVDKIYLSYVTLIMLNCEQVNIGIGLGKA